MKKKPDSNSSPWRAISLVSLIGADLVVCLLIGFYLGRYVSDLMNGQPIFIAAGVILGLAAGILSIVYILKRFTEEPNG
ncbi:AtpZ/AtpI family protein [Paenibacillus gansuensis]|uniref:AtpZ/AtpI family protein n=1 Tax=Paenibacillus gansuensis TaxID=306542 RepID=A0ABW5PKQ7_9BACL